MINPALVGTLISMTHDARFSVTIEIVQDLSGFDSAKLPCGLCPQIPGGLAGDVR